MEIANFFQASLDNAVKRVGDSGQLYVEDATAESQRGLRFLNLALPYLFFSGILPFGKILGLAGAKATMKSAFGFWLGQFVMACGGGYHLVETEGKLNEVFMNSFMPRGTTHNKHVDYVGTLEEAQDCVTNVIKRYKASKVRNPFPLILGVDSLAGSDTQNTYDKIEKEGHSQRGYAEAALLWSPYFKKLSSDLVGTDILLYFTNHLKEKSDGQGFGKQYSKQGGASQDFHAAQYIYFSRVSNIDQVSREGKLIQLKAEKCGLGPDNRKIQVPVLWRHEMDEETDEPVQISWWDWNAATAKLLAEGSKVVLPKRVQSQLDVKCSSNKYSSETLGITNASDTEFGELLSTNTEYMEMFRKLVGYHNWTEIGVQNES